MTRLRSALVLAAVTALVAVGVVNAGSTATSLKGTVGPGFTITLKDASGKVVKSLMAGTYKITVSDKSSIHSFRLKGPGLNKEITSVPFTGTKTVTVTLGKGTYTYQCDPHASSMHGSFKVG